jgi:hypothetical protein
MQTMKEAAGKHVRLSVSTFYHYSESLVKLVCLFKLLYDRT